MTIRAIPVILLVLMPAPVLADSKAEVAFARKVLEKLQLRSIIENREYCGFIGRDDDGHLVATKASPGTADRCWSDWPEDITVTASYHTHSAYDPDAWSEIPSDIDIEGDEEMGIDGYISTPGGRFWYVDTTDMVVSQICGVGCLRQDKRFDPSGDGKIKLSYTYEELLEKLGE